MSQWCLNGVRTEFPYSNEKFFNLPTYDPDLKEKGEGWIITEFFKKSELTLIQGRCFEQNQQFVNKKGFIKLSMSTKCELMLCRKVFVLYVVLLFISLVYLYYLSVQWLIQLSSWLNVNYRLLLSDNTGTQLTIVRTPTQPGTTSCPFATLGTVQIPA